MSKSRKCIWTKHNRGRKLQTTHRSWVTNDGKVRMAVCSVQKHKKAWSVICSANTKAGRFVTKSKVVHLSLESARKYACNLLNASTEHLTDDWKYDALRREIQEKKRASDARWD